MFLDIGWIVRFNAVDTEIAQNAHLLKNFHLLPSKIIKKSLIKHYKIRSIKMPYIQGTWRHHLRITSWKTKRKRILFRLIDVFAEFPAFEYVGFTVPNTQKRK